MPWFRGAKLGMVHMKLSGSKKNWPQPCQAKWQDTTEWCACLASYQCDWKGDGRHRCDKHLCPEHQAAYPAWLARRNAVMLRKGAA